MSYPQPGWGPGYQQPPPPPPRRSNAVLILGIIGAMGACCIGAGIFGRNGSSANGGSGAGIAPAQREYITQSCSDVVNIFSNNTQYTELQRRSMWDSQYKGRWVRWTATVNTVDQAVFGGYQMQFKCSTASLLMDGHATFGTEQQARLLQLRRGDTVAFTGKLNDWGQLLGISIQDAEVQ